MKKLFLICLVILSMNAFAQSKGDKYFLLSGCVSFGEVKSFSYINNHVDGLAQPMNRYLSASVGFGYFIDGDFRMELVVSLYNEKDPVEQSGSHWLYDTFKGVTFNPNFSFNIKLADKLYYAPEFGASFDLGYYNYQQTYSGSFEYPYRGYSFYIHLLALEYRVNEKLGIGMSIGTAQYTIRKYYDGDKMFGEINQLMFYLNQAMVNVRFFF